MTTIYAPSIVTPAPLAPRPARRAAPLSVRVRAAAERAAWRAVHVAFPVAKRAIDVAVAGAALVAVSPVLAAVAVAIKLEDGGPLLYVRPRVGRGGRPFRFLKFRSMGTDADAKRAALVSRSDDGDAVRFKMRNDPRVTRVGRVIRRLSIDELPQLWNVLRGDMTLVGPRPPIPAETAKYGPRDWARLDVTPGITCIWQVSGRADVPFPRQVEMDLDYAARRSLFLDLALLARTVPAVLSGKGAC